MKRNTTIGAGVLVLIVFVLNCMLRFVPAASVANDINPYLTVALLQLLVFMIPSLLYTKLRFAERVPSLRLRLPRLRHLLFMFAALGAIVLGSTLINYGMSLALGDAYQASSSSAKALDAGSGAMDGL